jgi:hypothetical protein
MKAQAAGAGHYESHRDHPARQTRLGGVKIGSAFFGWMTATGIFVLLAGLAAGIGALFGIASSADPSVLAEQAGQDLRSVSIIGAVILAVIIFLAYFSGGYVAGRMARYDGARQGIAVWLWAVVVAGIIAALGTVTGTVSGAQLDVPALLASFPGVPLNEGTMTTGGIVVLIGIGLLSLVSAVLGGKAGMHYHRKVDQTEASGYADWNADGSGA